MNAPPAKQPGARRPTHILLGQGKAGSSLIYRELQKIPAIGLSDRKELHYFSADYAKGPDWYASHFAHVSPDLPVVAEISPSYLQPDAVRRIHADLGPDTRLIFVLRQPVEHAYSRYLQNICAHQCGRTFTLYARAMTKRLGESFRAIRLCYELFGEDNILSLVFERDVTAPGRPYLKKLLAFMGLPDAECPPPEGIANPGIMPRYLLTRDAPLHMVLFGQEYRIPADRLVFCGQPRNSTVTVKPTDDDVRRALHRQGMWSTELSQAEYACLQQTHADPFMRRLNRRFGIDLEVWENRARRIHYEQAPPPPRFIAGNNRLPGGISEDAVPDAG